MGESELRDFEIHIRESSADATWPVTMCYPEEDRRGEGVIHRPCSDAEVNRARAWMESGYFDEDYVKQFGAALFQGLFVGELKELYEGSRQSSANRLRIRLIVDAPVLASIPWELLYDPGRGAFLALEGPFVRGASSTEPTRPLTVKPPLRILVVDAFPRGMPKIADQAETAGIQKALADLIRRRRVEVEAVPHATLEGLQNQLREASNPEHPQPFHVLHFIGHGQHDPATGHSVLLFETGEGQIDPVDADRLINTVGEYDLKLVFLTACQSVQSSALDVTQGFAPTLLARGVPAVIGMQATVLADLATQISRQFYEALADNLPVDVALTHARRLLSSPREHRQADPGIPVCYLRTATGQILEVQPPDEIALTRATLGPWLRRRVTPGRVAGGVVGLVGLVASLLQIGGAIPAVFSGVPRMTGGFNVAVAEFGGLNPEGGVTRLDQASDLAESVYELLDDELKKSVSEGMETTGVSFDVQIAPPPQTGRLTAPTREERARQAAKLAEDKQGDLIVYGNLEPKADTTTFIPEFYLSERKLAGAEELHGQYEFGSPIRRPGNIATNLVTRETMRRALLARTRALAQFVIGLSYYTLGEHASAARYFNTAAATTEWDDQDGKEVLYHFLGNTAGKLGDLPSAGGYYARALQLEPEYARAHLGTAEVLLIQNSGRNCEAGTVDQGDLERAVDSYQRARTAAIRPALSDIETKAALGLGRAYVCLSQALIADHWTDAERELRKVIADFDGGNQRVKDLAAEAHAGLAWIDLPNVGDPEPEPKLRSAADEYRKAGELSRQPQRQALFYGLLGYTLGRLKNYDQADAAYAKADAAYAEAIQVDPDNRAAYEERRRRLQQERAALSGAPRMPAVDRS